MKLVSDLKQFLILNDFSAIGDSVESSRMKYKSNEEENDRKIMALRDEVCFVLYCF